MKVLITGISGMVGSHLVEYILNEHPEVNIHGLIRWRTPLEHLLPVKERITLHYADLRDLNSLIVLVKKVQPEWIFHLAAQSFVTTSFDAPVDTLSTNVIGTTNLLDALRITGVDAKVHVCSSSEVYGQVLPDEVPIQESNPFRPASPYAVSKVGEDMVAFQYFLSYGIRTVRTRMFTHTGPRRGDVFAESAYAKQIVEVENGIRKNPIRVGNLDSIRTFADVRDAVRAYWMLMEKCPAGEVYNIGGSRTMTLRDMLEILKGMATCNITHVVDPALLRPSDVTLQIPDTSKFKAATGWEPRIPFEETLRNILDFYRRQYRKRSKAA
jgi:GDPmannose 4,6-dehydratase/GDP-4-dehydro-6-deoxy-D-mannose reductase